MKRNLLSAILIFSILFVYGQESPFQRPSVYKQVDQVRKELNLDQKQFDKLYSAYEKYNKAVFGDEYSGQAFGMPPIGRGSRPGGGPGEGPGGRGGMGPGGGAGGMFPGGGFDSPNGQNGMADSTQNMDRPSRNDSQKPENFEKFEKTKTKQEEKLVKSVKKLFKKDEQLFIKWQEIRERQLQQLFPQPPRFQKEDGREKNK